MNITPHITASVDIAALAANFRITRALAAGKRVAAVVKADAYGHGAALCAAALADAGADFFAVSSTSEAVELRRALDGADLPGNKPDIIILGWTDPADAAVLVEYGVIQTAADAEHLRLLEYAVAAAKSRRFLPGGARLDVQLKLDTGMNRIGFDPSDAADAARYARSPHVRLTGAFTHLPRADTPGEDADRATRRAVERFSASARRLEAAISSESTELPELSASSHATSASSPVLLASSPESSPPFCLHFANSAALLRYGELFGADYKSDAVRAGIILYGLAPSPETEGLTASLGFTPVMSLRSTVSHVHTVPAGGEVSYGGTWTAERETKLATIPAGYADGIPRALSNRGAVYIGGARCPIRGRVCMDQLMADVTDVPHPVSAGDAVEFFGAVHTASELAASADMIAYELVSGISKRVPRLVISN